MEVENLANKLQSLVQYKNKSYTELLEIAKEKLALKDEADDLDINLLFKDKKEKKAAKELLNIYLKTYEIETISDKNMLKQLIFLEIVNVRLQNILNDQKEAATTEVVNLKVLDGVHKNIQEINNIKNNMGIAGQREKDDVYKTIQLFKRKFKLWRENNNGSRWLACPHCGQMTLLKIRMDMWEAQKHPFFKDRILANEHLMKMYKEGKISRKDVALVLECSGDYIDWMIKRVKF